MCASNSFTSSQVPFSSQSSSFSSNSYSNVGSGAMGATQRTNTSSRSGVMTMLANGTTPMNMTVTTSRSNNTVMMAEGPTVSGDTNLVVDMNEKHMDKEVAKMGINGFGRIGRLVFRSTFMHQRDKAIVTAVNAPNKDLGYLKYLLEFDSVHGRFPFKVEVADGGLTVDG